MLVTMAQIWMWIAAITATATASEIIDKEYYQMPPLYEIDDFKECFANNGGAFCVGSFLLQPSSNEKLYSFIKNYSEEKCNYNHIQIHRGYCVSSRCKDSPGASLVDRFETCVENITRHQYRLGVKLARLEYCRTADQRAWRAIDTLDIAFAVLVVITAFVNFIGTAYDVVKGSDTKRNKYMLTWSLKQNWARLFANYKNGNPRLTALTPIHGVKAITLMLIVLAHSVVMYHMPFISDPLGLEKTCHHPMLIFIQNGTAIVQTFIMFSSFLFAYNLLLHSENNPKNILSLYQLPKYLINRIFRILPAYIIVLGAAMTWWSLSSDGPLWEPMMGGECRRCREKWWTHLLFLNQLINPNVKCLTHTWFLAVDMQLYLVSAVLTLTLGGNPRRGLKVLAGLFLAAILGNFFIAYYFELASMFTLIIPRCMLTLFTGEKSFLWLYQSPWNNLPSSLIGVFAAFLHFYLQREGRSPKDCQWFRVVYRLSVPGMFLWVFLGYFIKDISNSVAVALYASVDRAILTMFTTTAMFGFINKIDSLYWRFLSWRGWVVMGRMSLSVYLLHWLHALMPLAMKSHYTTASIHEIGGHFLWTLFASYWTALPLHLCVELPMHKFLQNAFSDFSCWLQRGFAARRNR